MGHQRTWEGGFNAPEIACYKVDHNGVIEDFPSIWQRFEEGRTLTTFRPKVQNEFEEQPLADIEPDAATLYESADWMKETELPARFETVRLKEQ
jgi:hypothetical protein